MNSIAFLHLARKCGAAVTLFAVPVIAQTGLGTVRGIVEDSTQAVLPDVKVTLENTSTGVIQTGKTNSAGVYYFGGVRIGPYQLTVEANGFKRWEGNLLVEAGAIVVVNPAMEIGSLQATVQVTGATPIVATEGAQVSDVKDAVRIHDLPLNGRQVSNLFGLTAGVEGGGGNTRTNGMKVGATEMTLDGISYVDRFGGTISRVQPGLDTIQEFRIETAGSGAQFSRPATIEMVTRSGTNALHGAVFETFRNNADGLRARQRQDGNTAAKLIRNEYGGWVGGPVILPHLYNGKNKTFFLFDWEGAKVRQNQFGTTGVATPSMWNGDLSNITDTSGDKITLYDPLSTTSTGVRLPFQNNVIPTNRLSAYAKIFESVSPLPNGPNAGGNPWTDLNFQAYYPVTQDQHSLTIKIDHNFSEKDTISGRFTDSPFSGKQYGGKYGFPPPGCTNCGGTARQDYSVYSSYVRWNHVFSPTLLNELQVSNHRSGANYGTLGDSTKWADKLGLPNPFGVTGWPTVYTDAYNMFYGGGWDGDNKNFQYLTAFEVSDGVTWVKGKHTIKAGFKGRQEFNNVNQLQQAQGSHSFYANWTALYDPSSESATPYTGSGFAELLLGLPTALRDQYNRGYFYFQQKEIGAYVNDTWKLGRRLTVDLGLRWDHWTTYHEKYDRLVNLDPSNYVNSFQVISPHGTTIDSLPNIPSGVLGSWQARGLSWVTANSVSGFPGALVPDTWGDWGPRLAAAYQITSKWVLRAGYGIYYWPTPLSQILAASRTNPPLNLNFVNHLDTANGTFFNRALLISPTSNDYLPNATVNVTGIQGISQTAQTIYVMDPHNWNDNRMQQWELTLERELTRNTSLRLSYIGNHGSNLEQRVAFSSPQSQLNYQMQTGLAAQTNADLRRPNPNWNGLDVAHVGYSNSNSFQVEVQRRFSNGLAFQWFFTHNHIMTTADESGFGSGGGNSLVPMNSTILGNPNLTFDQRLRLVYANSASVPPQRISWNGIYELPFGKGKRFAGHVSRAGNAVVGGWQVAFIGTWQSGNWSSVATNEYLFGNPTLDSGQRLTMNIFGQTQMLYFKGDFDPTQATNVNQSQLQQLVPADRSQRVLRPVGPNFSNQIPFVLANGQVRNTTITDNLSWNPQNFFLGPGQWNEDFSIFKYFDITETARVRFTADFFNVLNHPVDIAPNRNTGLINLSQQANDPRIIQFSARMEW